MISKYLPVAEVQNMNLEYHNLKKKRWCNTVHKA